MAEEIEKIYVIPLNKKGFKRTRAAPTAIKRVKSYLTKHMKVEEEKIWIDASLNNAIWNKGKYSIDSKIRVKAVKFDDGVVEAYLPELEFKKSRREILKEEKAKKEPILKKEEKPEEGEVAGAEDYDIAPSADGEVKIKKKKTPKEKDEKTEEKPIKKKPSEKSEKKETKKVEKKPEEKKDKPKDAPKQEKSKEEKPIEKKPTVKPKEEKPEKKETKKVEKKTEEKKKEEKK